MHDANKGLLLLPGGQGRAVELLGARTDCENKGTLQSLCTRPDAAMRAASTADRSLLFFHPLQSTASLKMSQ